MTAQELLHRFDVTLQELERLRDAGTCPRDDVADLVARLQGWLQSQSEFGEFFSEAAPPDPAPQPAPVIRPGGTRGAGRPRRA